MYRSQAGETGYAYVAQFMGYHKIGHSTMPVERRLLAMCLPEIPEAVCIIPCSDWRMMERWLHKQYSHRRVRGEWFRLTSEDIEAIRALDPTKIITRKNRGLLYPLSNADLGRTRRPNKKRPEATA